MSAKRHIEPNFEPGSGWYKPTGQWAPGSLRDQEARLLAAWPCTVVVLYRNGERIPAAELLRADHLSGSLLLMDEYTHPNWHARLVSDPSALVSDVLPRLMFARLERKNNGIRLYGGMEFADRGREEWRQAWLCGPERRLREILAKMVEQEGRTPSA